MFNDLHDLSLSISRLNRDDHQTTTSRMEICTAVALKMPAFPLRAVLDDSKSLCNLTPLLTILHFSSASFNHIITRSLHTDLIVKIAKAGESWLQKA
jgi:hypothetical protein